MRQMTLKIDFVVVYCLVMPLVFAFRGQTTEMALTIFAAAVPMFCRALISK